MAGTTRGAESLGDDDGGDGDGRKGAGRLKWLLLGLLAVAAVIALIALVSGGNDEGGGSASTQATAPTVEQPTPTAGTLSADGEELLPIPDGGASDLAGREAEGTGVEVVKINPGEGFWVGTSQEERVYVEYGGDVGETEEGSESFEPQVGDKVNLRGEVRPAPEEPEQTLNITDEQDARLVTQQGFFVNATEVERAS